MKGRRRAFVIITEGAAPELLDRWCADGQLPHLSRLRAMGASGTLAAEGVPYEPPGLVSLLTGQPAGEHGFFSYWTCHDAEYRPQVLTSRERRHPLIWQRPELAGIRTAAMGIFGTHPAEPLDGWLITYPMYPTLRAAYPSDLQQRLARRGIRPVHDVSIFWSGQPRDELLPQLLEADRQRGAMAMAFYEDGADLVLVNLTSIDRTSHIYLHELDAGSPHQSDSAVLAAYRTCDEVVGAALARLDGDTTLIAFSEIGFGPLRSYCSMNDELAALGLLSTDGDSGVDFSRSAAFEAVQGTHGVNVNLRGRYKHGTVAGVDYERARDDIAAGLLERVNPRTGLPFLSAVRRREEVYSGSAVSLAPDLILEPADWRYLPLGDPTWARHVHRTWQSGWHRNRSYWAAYGPDIRPGSYARIASPIDVTASVYHALARDLPADLVGTGLTA